jgi:hypothetical protein
VVELVGSWLEVAVDRSVGGGHEKQFLIITVPLGHFAIQEKQQQLIWSGIACSSLLPAT